MLQAFRRNGLLYMLLVLSATVMSQELYVYTEPASNMPAHSISTKLTGHFVARDNIYGRFSQRYMPEVMFGINKKWMVHVSATFADMHTNNFNFESVSLYGKYRFLSKDEIHQHFRMAVFADASYTRVPFHYDEITLMVDDEDRPFTVIQGQREQLVDVWFGEGTFRIR